jgi:hypothetical protein
LVYARLGEKEEAFAWLSTEVTSLDDELMHSSRYSVRRACIGSTRIALRAG